MAGPKVTFRADSSPDSANYAYELVGIASLGPLVALVAALIPTGLERRWDLFVAAVVVLGVTLAILIHDLRRLAASGGHRSMSPNRSVVVNLLATSGCALLLLSSGLPQGIWSPVLLLPACVQVLIGDRRMVICSLAAAGAWVVVGLALAHADLGTTIAVTILFGGSWLLVLGILRLASMASTVGIEMSERFARLTEVAATATSEPEGLAELLDHAGRLLRAGRVDLVEVGAGPARLVASWRSSDGHHTDLDLDGVDAVAASGEARIQPGRVVAPVPGHAGTRLVLVVAEPVVHRGVMTSTFAYRIDRICLQIGTLVDRLRLLDQLETLIRTDSLTGLPNRRALSERLGEEVARARRNATPLALVMIDLDEFKRYNDDFGHVAGDEALQGVAHILRERLRTTDFLGRFGGEEFVALLPDTTVESAGQLLEELHVLVREHAAHRVLTFSAGVARWDQLESPEELLVRADAALYDAKASGRDRTCVHEVVDDFGAIGDRPVPMSAEPFVAPFPAATGPEPHRPWPSRP